MLGNFLQLLTHSYVWIILLVASLFYLKKWIKKRKKKHSLFKRLGIPYKKPHFIYGNFNQLKGNSKQNELETTGQWIKQFGKVYGYYVGEVPYISISNLDMIRSILVKDFANFANRPTLIIKADPVIDTLVGLRDQRWKDVRSLLTPTFSSSKMRLMIAAMNKKVDVMLNIVEESNHNKTEIDLYQIYQGLTLDVISECALAMNTNCQKDQDKDPFFKAVRSFLKNAINPAVKLAIYFPPFAKFLALLSNNLALSGRATLMITENLRKVIAYRRARPNERKLDILQLMLDASEELDNQKNSKKVISDKELIANAWVFLLGGFETTAAALTFTSYLLAKHPEVQNKLYNEIKDQIKDSNNQVSYDDVFNLTYLDQVLNESLRLYPPVVTFMTREAKEDIMVEDLFIPKGTCVSIPVWQIHHDPELWPDPNKFDPERFSSSSKIKENRHPMSFIPFGEGPRKCIGMRFAQMEAKLALARILSNYRLEATKLTPDPMTFEIPTVTLTPDQKMFIRVIKRT